MGAVRICLRMILQAWKNKTLAILLFVPIISFLIASMLSMPTINTVSIGVLDEDGSRVSESLINMLEGNDSFELDTDIRDVDEMKEKMQNQDIVIGMRINKNLYNNIEKSGSVQLFQTYDIETFKLVELYLNSSIDNMILLKKSTDTQVEMAEALEEYNAKEFLDVDTLSDEDAKSKFASTAFGFLTMFMLLVSVLSSKLIADDRFNTTIKRIFMAPIRKTTYLAACFLTNLVFQLIQIGVTLLISVVMGFEFSLPLYAVAIILALFSVFSSFFGVLVGFIAKSNNQMLIIAQLFMLPGMLLCGTFFEFSLMPSWLQNIAYFFPQTWVSQASLYFEGSLLSSYFLTMIGYFALVCLVIGSYLLIIFKRGKLGSFY